MFLPVMMGGRATSFYGFIRIPAANIYLNFFAVKRNLSRLGVLEKLGRLATSVWLFITNLRLGVFFGGIFSAAHGWHSRPLRRVNQPLPANVIKAARTTAWP